MASSMVMRNRVMAGSVRVRGPPEEICCRNRGMTLPRVPMTLPHRVQVIRVRLGPREAALARAAFP